MSGAKQRMRSKKMRNQPSNVTFSAAGWQGRGEASFSGRRSEHTPPMRGHGPRPSGSHYQSGGWVRGHYGGGDAKGGQGYAEGLPKYITASTFAKARAAEVCAMVKAVSKTTGSSHVFGALPKHMRRRAMSHDTKRLPARLREGAQKMLEKSQRASQKEKKEQSKTKSRKARRRHGNLLLEFNRRQRKNVWLETHIWHAKRFHMVKRWGYCLGHRPTYKCYRACYRAMSNYCLLQDLSYYCCVELQGPEEQLLPALSRLTSKETGPTFATALCLSGRRQGSAVLYRADRYPTQPLGPVLFLWRPRSEHSTHRQLWIWAHPTMKQDLLPELQAVCQCTVAVVPPAPVAHPAAEPDPAPAPGPTETAGKEQPEGRKRKRAGEESEVAVPVKKILGDGTRSPTTPVSWKSNSTEIVIRDLTMEIVRYRLIGPLSHSVLTDTLAPASECEAASKTETSCFWWPEHCKEEGNMSLHREQANVFQLLKGVFSTAEIPAGSVLGLTVDDPRLTLPAKRTKVGPDIQQLQGGDEDADRRRALTLQGIPEHCCQSSLWDESVRDNVTTNKIPEQELNRMKNELLVPGSRLHPTPPQGRVPMLLVQQAGKQVGSEMASWGAGWDLLLPKGWGMAFWVPLVYRGVRIGGLQEALKHSQNKGASHFPHDFPDCPAGARFQQEQETELCAAYKRRPPAKRTNYIKHGCLAPFRCPWQQLAEEWEMIVREGGDVDRPVPAPHPHPDPQPRSREEASIPQPEEGTSHSDSGVSPQSGFTVLRNRKVLRRLSAWCTPTTSRGQRSWRSAQSTQVEQLSPASTAPLCAVYSRSLVWARLSLLRKGRPTLHATVCVPTLDDIELLRRDPAFCGPQEPRHMDHFKSRLKKRKKGQKAATSSAKPESLPAEPGSAPSLTPGSAPSLTLGLWPDPLPSVTSHCSRVTLGWVTQGDFTLSAGCGEALGFVSLTGLLHMLPEQPPDLRGLVLLRNPSSLQYRFAKINIEV
ncbi:ribonucleases P/MRP protein subunit POP1 [Megalops cyprinoides]|uniref:ribonucleases P/MRP protein subunit POP1 n=1 Tax=Megalops cyprinoides TaxID=118141 RepID=UPI0018648DBE|nr:ribonucleases P/MRP protein subunit POP1 [Megalops cyprinoides]